MTAILLSVHVLAAIVLIGPITVAASLFPRYARAEVSDGQNLAVLRALHRITSGYAVAALVVPVFGLATAVQLKVLGDVWLLTSIALTAIAAALLGLAIVPGQRQVVSELESRSRGREAAGQGRTGGPEGAVRQGRAGGPRGAARQGGAGGPERAEPAGVREAAGQEAAGGETAGRETAGRETVRPGGAEHAAGHAVRDTAAGQGRPEPGHPEPGQTEPGPATPNHAGPARDELEQGLPVGVLLSRLAMRTGLFSLTWAIVVVLMIVRPGSTTGS